MNALTWSGSKTTLSLFALFRNGSPLPSLAHGEYVRPQNVQVFRLEDVLGFASGRECVEYDLEYAGIHTLNEREIETVARSCLSEAINAGADVAWFGFEASFAFDSLLDATVAHGIWAVSTPQNQLFALNDDLRQSEQWADAVSAVRRSLGLKDSSRRVQVSAADRRSLISSGLPFTITSADSSGRDLTLGAANPRTLLDLDGRWVLEGPNQKVDSVTASVEALVLASSSMVGDVVIEITIYESAPELVIAFESGRTLEIDTSAEGAPWALSLANSPIVFFGRSARS